MTTALSERVVTDLVAATAAASIPDVYWILGDDKCDCTFQRIGHWTNPYIARTKVVRLCCIWAELEKAFPQHVQNIDASYDHNRHEYDTAPREWDSEDMPMPYSFWFRQLAAKTGRSLASIRAEYANRLDECPGPIPPGTAVKDVPTAEEQRYALEARLRAATWNVRIEG